MKVVVKISNMNSQGDELKIQEALANAEGVLACEIKKSSSSVTVIYDKLYIDESEVIDIIENLGYITI